MRAIHRNHHTSVMCSGCGTTWQGRFVADSRNVAARLKAMVDSAVLHRGESDACPNCGSPWTGRWSLLDQVRPGT